MSERLPCEGRVFEVKGFGCAGCPLYFYLECHLPTCFHLCLHPSHPRENDGQGLPVTDDAIPCPLDLNGPLTIRRKR